MPLTLTSLLLLTALGFVPSLLWLGLYLHEDRKPEPKRYVLAVFAGGIFAAFFAAIVEINLACFFIGAQCQREPEAINDIISNVGSISSILFAFLGVALPEELLKYFAVVVAVLRRKVFDEPIDAMLYLIIAALGFATVENVLTVRNLASQGNSLDAIGNVLILRFLGATFLHTLASGVVGYGLAWAFFRKKAHLLMVIPGLLIATLLHGLYNILITQTANAAQESGDSFQYLLRAVIVLLALSAGGLILMMRHLTAVGRAHAFVNLGDHAQEK